MSPISQSTRLKGYACAALWYITFAGAGVLMREHQLDAPALRQIFFLACLTFAVVSLPGLIKTMAAFTPLQRVIVVLIPGLILTGQVMERRAEFFPFSAWTMYTELEKNPAHFDQLKFWGYTAQGERVPVRYKSDSPGLLTSTIFTLDSFEKEIAREPSSERSERLKERVRHTMQVVARRHNARHPDKPIVELVFERTPVSIDWAGKAITKRETFEWRERVAEAAP